MVAAKSVVCLLASVVAALAFTASARADTASVSVLGVTPPAFPGGSPQITATFSVTHDTCVALVPGSPVEFCAWFPTATIAPAGQDCSPSRNYLWVGRSQPDRGTQAATETSYLPNGYGSYRICVYVTSASVTPALVGVSEHAFTGPATTPPPPPPSPPPAQTPTADPGDSTEPIPAHVGRRGYASFRLNVTDGPSYLNADRWENIVTRSATRWGAVKSGYTSRLAGHRDGQDVVSFGHTRRGTLGVTYTWRSRRTGRVAERDIRVGVRVPLHPGPGHPSVESYDLETIVVHEMGHFVGNRGHASWCANSPMQEGLDAGEWWRSTTDWYFHGCAAQTRALRAHRAKPMRFVEITRYVDDPSPAADRSGKGR